MRFLFCVALFTSVCALAHADDLSISGLVQLGSNYIDFGLLNGTAYPPAPGYGEFQVSSVSSGSVFGSEGVTAGENGMVQSLNAGTGPVTLSFPFITFDGLGATTSLWATSIPAGAVGPLNLMDTAQGAVAEFQVIGDINNDTSDPFTAQFELGFAGYTVADLFSHLPDNGQYCANIDANGTPTACDPFASSSSAPEPGSVLLVAAGLATAALGRKRQRQTPKSPLR